MIRSEEAAVKMIYLMFKAGHKLSSHRAGRRLWVMMDNQQKGRTAIGMFPLEKQNVTRTTNDISSSSIVGLQDDI